MQPKHVPTHALGLPPGLRSASSLILLTTLQEHARNSLIRGFYASSIALLRLRHGLMGKDHSGS
jgi:hypothetical protein